VAIRRFWISIIKGNENGLLLFVKVGPEGVSWPWGPTGKVITTRGSKKLADPALHCIGVLNEPFPRRTLDSV
jgi:hypothetical protein